MVRGDILSSSGSVERQFLDLATTLCRDDALQPMLTNVRDVMKIDVFRGDPWHPEIRIDAAYDGDKEESLDVVKATFELPKDGMDITVHRGSTKNLDNDLYACFLLGSMMGRYRSCGLRVAAIPYIPAVKSGGPRRFEPEERVSQGQTDRRRLQSADRSPGAFSDRHAYREFFGISHRNNPLG